MALPVMTQKCWAKFCMKVAKNDMINLYLLFRVGKDLVGDEEA